MILFEIVKSLRPYQWIKNLFIFAPLIFSLNIFDLSLVLKTAGAFAVFCVIAGATYIINDIKDIEEDRLHPLKSKRPLASGKLSVGQAVISVVLLVVLGLGAAFLLHFHFFLICLVYFLLQLAYSFRLKHIVILDVFIIAAGFFIRVIAGGLAIEVDISPWLLICTILLSLFLALSKRRHELIVLDKSAAQHRPILKEYNTTLLDQMIAVVTASTVIAYCLYTISTETITKFGTSKLIYTVPFVLYGIFRYLYLIHQKAEGGSPEILIIKDKPLLIDVFFWIITAIIIIYV